MTSMSPFTEETKERIKSICEEHCSFCMKYLSESDPSECFPFLDAPALSWVIKAKVLKESDSISADLNGILLCVNCYNHFSPNHAVFSPPVQLLRYLVVLIQEFDIIPLFEMLDALRDSAISHSWLVKPFSDIYTVLPLALKRLQMNNHVFYRKPGVSELIRNRWHFVPLHKQPKSNLLATIFDGTIYPRIPSSGANVVAVYWESFLLQRRYFRLASTRMRFVLAHLVFYAGTTVGCHQLEELQLARQLYISLYQKERYNKGIPNP